MWDLNLPEMLIIFVLQLGGGAALGFVAGRRVADTQVGQALFAVALSLAIAILFWSGTDALFMGVDFTRQLYRYGLLSILTFAGFIAGGAIGARLKGK